MIWTKSNPLIVIIAIGITGCTGMKNISSTDPLYVGSEIQFDDDVDGKKGLKAIAKSVIRPAPNNTFLWMRPAVARNNMLSEKARKGKFWKNKVSEPVLLSQLSPTQISAAIHDRVFHNAYFQNKVNYDTIFAGNRKAKFRYTITLNEPYCFDSIFFPIPTSDLTRAISDSKSESLLKEGSRYTLETIKNERVRIDRNLKENGFIYFNPDFILLKLDTATVDHRVRAEVTVKRETPPESRKPYAIRNVFIHDDHVLDDMFTDTLQFERYYLISQHHTLKIQVLQQGFFLKPGGLYSHSNYVQTVRYMSELPIVRSASLKFAPIENTDEVDVTLYLSQRKRYAYSAEFNAIFRSTNYFGPGVIFSFSDRNRNKGSELLKVNLRGRFEMQISEGQINPAYELGVEVNYTLPRFYPTFLFHTQRKSLPKTNISAGYNLFNRLDLYRLNSVYANFGYRWSKSSRMSHTLNPMEIIFTRIPESSKSGAFLDYLEQNPGVQRSFDEQFIVGSSYEFTYNPAQGGSDGFFFRGGIDFAGNLMNVLYSAFDARKDSLGRYNLLGVPFSQYIRTRIDMRYSFNLSRRSQIVARFSAGVGIPLGNSNVLPYVKQFYVGGTNSLRSFIARSVGPGSETPPEGYNDLTGDIRIEGNLEYRFDVAGSLKGALFLDAGNIWLYNDDPTRPNGTFHFDTFLNEIAISSGWGLRWDFDFLVARLDFAYTLRTPYLPVGERWADSFKVLKPSINIAIGYPF